jgi:L-ascorbate metabolism protein UlaG (beta-lactamase superfamily)
MTTPLRQRIRMLASVVAARRAIRQEARREGVTQSHHGLSGADVELMDDPSLAAVWLGHATTLIHLEGKWILTDPVFSGRCGPWLRVFTHIQQFGPRRVAPLPIEIHELPEIDLILLSHAHFDHLDTWSLDVLASRRTRVVTARRTQRLVPRGYGQVTELDWDQSLTIDGLTISAIRPRHWGGRWYVDRYRGYNSYLIGGRERSVLFAGDSATTRVFDRVGETVPDLALAIMGIGAYEPWDDTHSTPEETWGMFVNSGARALMPMHHSTFILSKEPILEPIHRLMAVAGEQGARVVGREPGEVWIDRGVRPGGSVAPVEMASSSTASRAAARAGGPSGATSGAASGARKAPRADAADDATTAPLFGAQSGRA